MLPGRVMFAFESTNVQVRGQFTKRTIHKGAEQCFLSIEQTPHPGKPHKLPKVEDVEVTGECIFIPM